MDRGVDVVVGRAEDALPDDEVVGVGVVAGIAPDVGMDLLAALPRSR
jgi:hypothetical protein